MINININSGGMDNESTGSRNWTKEATTLLIQQYQVQECMWMTTSPYYRNKQKRSEALINIAIAVSKLRPQTTAEEIKNKINGIRTQYVSEINKLILAENRGEPYKPTLWCFEYLSFLKPYTQPKQKSVNNWSLSATSKPFRAQLTTVPNASQPQLVIHEAQPQPSEPIEKKECIIIKEEGDNDADVTIIEETLPPHLKEKRRYEEQQQSSSSKEVTLIKNSNTDNENQDQKQHVTKIFPQPGIGAEITLVPAKNPGKRKSEDSVQHPEEKKKKFATELTLKEKLKRDEALENRITIFGKFVTSQMRIIKDKVLLIKLEHAIQNAIIEAQLKQLNIDENQKYTIEENLFKNKTV